MFRRGPNTWCQTPRVRRSDGCDARDTEHLVSDTRCSGVLCQRMSGSMSAVVAIPFRHGTLDTPLRRAAMVQGAKVGLIDGERQFTYAQLADRVGRLRTGLRTLGTDSGDRVAGLALNSSRHFEAWMAIPTANLIFNDLNFRLALAELEFI